MTPAATLGLLGGRLRWFETAPRPSEDSCWLAASVPPCPPGLPILDAACGAGAVGLMLWTRQPQTDLAGLDLDAALIDWAERHAALNAIPGQWACADLLALPAQARFPLVICNPPFHGRDRGHQSPNRTKAQAHGLPAGALAAWLDALAGQLTPGGALHMVLHHAQRAELLALLTRRGGAVWLAALAFHAGRGPKRLLVRWRPGPSPLQHHDLPPVAAYDPGLRTAVLKAGAALPIFPPDC